MKRTLIGAGLAGFVLLGPAALSAQAGTGHHHKPSCHETCTPAPTPPAGGWPCQATHSCHKPTHPHCPKPHKPPVKPPTQVTPKPPVVKHHPKPAPKPPHKTTTHLVTTPPKTVVTPQLPRTGGSDLPLGVAGLVLVVAGGVLRKVAR